ncbi:EAL domain-containing protein [Sulfurivermis fontis]|uniref:EAL domain-containing protein n=1 Tax=Sulfurivermis fontis TaxID=1972068 RepID=UPI000FDC3420|nr:EAL domain-containing protein [Sulfurivermis fontis]
MNWLYPLRRTIPLALILSSLPLLAVLYLLELRQADTGIQQELSQRAAHSGNQLTMLLRDALTHEDWESVRRTLQSVVTQPDLRWAVLVDEMDQVLYSTDYRLLQRSLTTLPDAPDTALLARTRQTLAGARRFDDTNTVLHAVYPLRLPLKSGELRAARIGALVFVYDAAPQLAQAYHNATWHAIYSFIGAVFIAGLFWLYLHFFLVRRIEQLTTAIQLGHADAAPLPHISGRDEIAQLSQQFTRLMQRLAAQNLDLQQAERHSRRLSDFYATLSHTNTAIVRSQSLDELLPRICTIAVENSGLSAAWIGFADEQMQIRPVASANMPEDYLANLHISLDPALPQGQGPTATAMRKGEHYLCNDFLHDPHTAAWHERARAAGFLASAAFPLRREGQVIGSLNLYGGEANLFSADLVHLLDEMALDISFALDNFLREERRHQAEQALERSNHELNKRVKEMRCLLDTSEIIAQHDLSLEEMLQQIAARIPPALQYAEQAWARITLNDRNYGVGGHGNGPAITAPIMHNGHSIGAIEAGYLQVPVAVADHPFLAEEHSLLGLLAAQIGRLFGQRQADEQLQLAALVFDNSRELIVITDAEERIISVNRAFTKVTGYEADEVIGKHIRTIKSGRQDQPFYAAMWQAINETGYWQGELWNRRKSGELYPALASISAVHDTQGKVSKYISVSTDITAYKQAEERIRYLAYYDPLTELPNRTLLRDRGEQILSKSERAHTAAAFLFLDLDHFKTINDSLGHLRGDTLLQEATQRIRAALRHTDTVGRLGGDEFLIVLGHTDATNAAHVARNLLMRLGQPFVIDGHTLNITASIGIAIYPNDGADFDDLMKSSDIAMYKAKELGRNRYHFFTPELNEAAMERLTLESALRTALEQNQLSLNYQPQIDLASGKVIGVEALLRWRHPQMGFISPAKFIPIAEESGLISQLGTWVLQESCRQNKAWQEAGLPPMVMAVNVSTRQFSLGDILAAVQHALHASDLQPEYLEVEITESLLAQDLENTLRVLEQLDRLGVQIAVDDFGTGYSSLAYLKRFPLHKLKLDQSFVRELENDADDRAIASGVVNLGHSLGLVVIAEGVETAAQLAILRRLGCDEIQGYLYSRPLPPEELASWLRQRSD